MRTILLYLLYHLNLLTSSEDQSSKDQNINFSVEHEERSSLSFLDVKIFRENDNFVTSVYRKPAFGLDFTNHESFSPTYQRRRILYTLLNRT